MAWHRPTRGNIDYHGRARDTEENFLLFDVLFSSKENNSFSIRTDCKSDWVERGWDENAPNHKEIMFSGSRFCMAFLQDDLSLTYVVNW